MMLSKRADADCGASSGLSLTSRCKMPVEMVSSTMLTARGRFRCLPAVLVALDEELLMWMQMLDVDVSVGGRR